MATTGDLERAVRILRALEAGQSQGSLTSQASDCAPVVEALGYYDLADHLRRLPRRLLPYDPNRVAAEIDESVARMNDVLTSTTEETR